MANKPNFGKNLYQWLDDNELTEYGSVISGSDVRKCLGIDYPVLGTKAEFDAISLAELAAVDYCRNILLGDGKYLAGDRGGYRILLPSENSKQVETYMRSADKKLNRALKLTRNTPKLDTVKQDNSAARIMMKRESIRSRINP